MVGTVNVSGTGLAAGEVPDGPQDFEATGEFLDLNGFITQAEGILTLTSPIVFNGSFALAGNTLDLDLSGNVVATAPVLAPIVSTPTSVTINVTPPAFIDSDNDGMDDSWEMANGLEVGIDDSGLDQDGDGRSSLEEFLALTDPQDPTSILKILTISRAADGNVSVQFSSTPGKAYQLQHSPDFATDFADVPGATLTATAAESSLAAMQQGLSRGYLRVVVVVQ